MKFQSQLLKMILFSLLPTVVFCTNALGACESLLEYGIYDIDGKTSDADRTASFREWICQRVFPAKADAAKFVASTAIPAEVLPVKLGPEDSEHDFKQSYAAFCSDTDMNSSLNQNLSRNLQKMNQKMLESFNACISREGLHAWIKQTKEPGKFHLNFMHRKPGNSPKPATVITMMRFNAACENLYLPFELAGSEKSFACRRLDTTTQSSLWILASEPVLEGNAYWVGKYTYTPSAAMPTPP